ncbi:cardiolipin synthase [Exiguobacterium sp. SH0S2]|uniref:cardiolipin synthase n=2 Tax=unclassified Exiguobacterium TaxID=2644629 RepID=UPI00103BF263|nr:cardiolipin synthase [Exiguobacterium sp. SH0S2]TCI36394.1 cardiolipin synthase [Exiguobacterium sp. SH4S7]TCI63342.1 cardiolipin synthase [Exiguobacterium sp. SH0S2]
MPLLKRRVIQLIMMIVSLVLLLVFLFWVDTLTPFLILIGVFAPLIVGWNILFDQVQPQAKLAWLLTVLFIPFLGALAWVLFGRTPKRHRRIKRTSSEIRMFRQAIEADRVETTNEVSDRFPLTRALEKMGATGADGHTATKLLVNGDEKYDAVLKDIEQATHHIHVQYYLFRTDEISLKIRDALIKRANENVTVRFLYDGLGSQEISEDFLEPLRKSRVHVEAFDPVLHPLLVFNANFRNHQKLIVLDGRIAYTGGLNVGDEYLGRHKKLGFWRDTHLRVEGPLVRELQRLFIENWLYAGHEEESETWDLFADAKHLPEYFINEPQDANGATQLLVTSPGKDVTIRDGMMRLLMEAKESIWITTPYLIPPPELLAVLEVAGKSGIDVRIVVPGQGDEWFSFHATEYYFEQLLKRNIRIYKYNRHFIHAKTVLIDGKIALVGTANFDFRSMYLNHEMTIAQFETSSIGQLHDAFLKDFDESILVDWSMLRKKSNGKRFIEAFCHIFSPLL